METFLSQTPKIGLELFMIIVWKKEGRNQNTICHKQRRRTRTA